ncbi:uncharacterized protein LOC126682455 [Mercurialis annua]|uniref:uncharacterized protein LOC126682455 n=1 Tax=Mercurialis annua TaxID=3986 RepID=UPI002160FEE9|nr:uncharacterized protein LOC126682455 [Mercurialis annua]
MEMEKKTEETALHSSSPDPETQPPAKPKNKHRRRNICLASTAATIVLIVVIIVILAFTVFKAKQPITQIDSMSLQNLDVALDVARLGVDLNMTLDVDLTVKNPNKVSMKYKNGLALLNYRGELVGEVPIPAGKMGSDETRPMNVTVTVMADRLLSNSQLFTDVMSGKLTMSALIKLSGKAAILNFIKISVDTTTTCDITVFVANATVADQKCKTKAKI